MERRIDSCANGAGSAPSRRRFLKVSAATAVAGGLPLFATPKAAVAAATKSAPAETAVKALYDSLTEAQKKVVCFAWDHKDKTRGLLRTFVGNNWQITEPTITGNDFYTKQQQGIVHDIFRGLINPEWYDRFLTQLKDDSEGDPWGAHQSFAIFGEPGSDKFEFVLTGRHQTLRADGHSQDHVAFGGPIFYGHSVGGANGKDHPGNVFWPQAVAANKLFAVLDEKQKKAALLPTSPREVAVAFRGAKLKDSPGLAVKDITSDQKAELQKVLALLVEPFRADDRSEVLACLKTQGGLDACKLTYYADPDIGEDKVWDNWRLEGPSFVWYFRGAPHVHVWVNVADDATIMTNSGA